MALLDPGVFDPLFYLNQNPDLLAAGLTSAADAQTHWLEHGVGEGRAACGAFHTEAYLARYADLSAALGDNYTAAAEHYVSTGRAEGRLGYVEGGGFGRYTASLQVGDDGDTLFVSASDRMAGGVDSLVFRDTEFVNAWDHGRELQYAVTNGYGECDNPTEAGRADDAQALSSTSVLQAVDAAGAQLRTSVLPAFWLAPGEREAAPTATCTVALNTDDVSGYRLDKNVTLQAAPGGGGGAAARFDASVLVAADCEQVQIEGPTGYMPFAFDQFYAFNASSGALEDVGHDTGELPLPLVFADADGSHAMAGVALGGSQAPAISYAKFYFDLGQPSNDCTKWSVVYRWPAQPAGTELSMSAMVCVGTVEEVVGCLSASASASASAE